MKNDRFRIPSHSTDVLRVMLKDLGLTHPQKGKIPAFKQCGWKQRNSGFLQFFFQSIVRWDFEWSRRVGLNHRPADYESAALPLSYAGSTWKENNHERQIELDHEFGRLPLWSFIPFVAWQRQLERAPATPRKEVKSGRTRKGHCRTISCILFTLSIDKA